MSSKEKIAEINKLICESCGADKPCAVPAMEDDICTRKSCNLMSNKLADKILSLFQIEVDCHECKFCPDDCSFLSPTEKEQNEKSIKGIHECTRYNEQVCHEHDHPQLHRVMNCHLDCSCNNGKITKPAESGDVGGIIK